MWLLNSFCVDSERPLFIQALFVGCDDILHCYKPTDQSGFPYKATFSERPPSETSLSFNGLNGMNGEMAHQRRALHPLSQDWSSAPRTYTKRLATTCNSSSTGCNPLFWLHTHLHVCIYAHRYTHTHKQHKSFKNSVWFFLELPLIENKTLFPSVTHKDLGLIQITYDLPYSSSAEDMGKEAGSWGPDGVMGWWIPMGNSCVEILIPSPSEYILT